MKNYIKHMSKQPYKTKWSDRDDTLNLWLGIIVFTMFMLYLLRYPILFIVSLFIK
jgi:hypothetical protein